MILATIVSGFAGFLSSAIPAAFKILQDSRDKEHELLLIDKQIEQLKFQGAQQLQIAEVQYESTEAEAIYKTYNSGVTWVDALNGTVRPVLAYAFFGLYAFLKYCYYKQGATGILWTEDDMVIFSAIISYYFGSRCFNKR